MLALGLVLPVLPRLVRDMLGGDTAQAAVACGMFGTSWAAMQLLCSPLVGALSDRFGRRPVALLSNFGQGFDYLVMAAAPTLSWLFLGRIISGITAASVSVGGAYIADVTPPAKRARAFGLLGAAFNLGFIAGPALGGILGAHNPRTPFWVAGALSLINACYGYFVLPESHPPHKRAVWSWKSVNPLASFTLLRSHPLLLGLAAVALLSNTAQEALPNVTVLYTDWRYSWTASTSGIALACAGAISALVQATLVGPVVRRYGERWVLLGSLLLGALGFVVYGLAPTGSIFAAGLPLLAISSGATAVLQALMTRHIRDDQQGSLQGAQSSLWGCAGLIGPTLFTTVFAEAISEGGGWTRGVVGMAFYLAAALFVVAAFLAAWVTRNEPVHAEDGHA